MGDYWEKRFLQDKAYSVNATEKYLAKEQKRYFTEAAGEITKHIEDMYQSFADQEHITLAEAKRRITRADFKKVDFEKLAEYQIDRNREFKKKKASLPGNVVAAIEKQHAQFESGLKALTRKGQITYLSLLQQNINKALLDLYDKNQMSIYDFLADEYESAYYRSVFNVQKGLGFGKDFAALNRRAIEKAILTTYKKSNYSMRLYAHCEDFSKNLKDNLIIGLIKGENIDKMAARISRRLDVAASSARRLVRTETTYIYEKATAAAYQECGIEKYEFLATLDYRTSPVCQELDGKVFFVKDAMPGKNYPPMHPNCRSTTVCHFDNDKVTERIAKNEKGRTYEVPSDMTYKEWKESVSPQVNPKKNREIQVIDPNRREASEKISVILQNAYERRRIKDSLHVSALDELSDNTKRNIFNVGIEGLDPEIQGNIVSQISYLTSKYKTTCYGITTVSVREAEMHKRALGWNVFMPEVYKSQIYLPPLKKEELVRRMGESVKKRNSVAIRPEDYLKYVITHEYGHTILNMEAGTKNWVRMDGAVIKKAQKEIREIYGEYKAKMLSLYIEHDKLKQRINSPDIEVQWEAFRASDVLKKDIDKNFISNYAGGYIRMQKNGKYYTAERDDLDEFMAESFAMHELGINKSPYAERVAEVLNKYFSW